MQIKVDSLVKLLIYMHKSSERECVLDLNLLNHAEHPTQYKPLHELGWSTLDNQEPRICALKQVREREHTKLKLVFQCSKSA